MFVFLVMLQLFIVFLWILVYDLNKVVGSRPSIIFMFQVVGDPETENNLALDIHLAFLDFFE